MTAVRIAVLGAGGMARETRALLNEFPAEWEFAGFVVSAPESATATDSKDEIVGSIADLVNGKIDVAAVTCGIGTPAVREALYQDIRQRAPSLLWPALVSRRAVIMDIDSMTFCDGVIVMPGAILTLNISLNENSLINWGATVGHETSVGAHSVINPGANVGGGVEIGAGVLVGSGAQVLQYLKVGDNATVAASACVTKPVPPGTTVIGIPAKPR